MTAVTCDHVMSVIQIKLGKTIFKLVLAVYKILKNKKYEKTIANEITI